MDINKCPACRDGLSTHSHHCHLRDLTKESFHKAVGCRRLSQRLLADGNWIHDSRLLAITRFEPIGICGSCNSLDSVDNSGRPGRWFSLSLPELKFIRSFPGCRGNNNSPDVKIVLAHLRRVAASDYYSRLRPAVRLGRVLAHERLTALGGQCPCQCLNERCFGE